MSKRKLLLADDSETVQKVVNLTFELEGIEVVTFGDGDSAMSQFSAISPDVVLADVNMPGMDGYEICQTIKSNEATKNTPVILLVGSFEPFDEQKAMQVGADDYLTKPFQSIRQLVSKVNELLATGTKDNADDIHLVDTLKMNETEYSESNFGDPGMDDEMIQTSQVGSLPADETSKYVTPNNFQTEAADISKTQPLSAKDLQDIYAREKTNEESNRTVYELADEPDESAEAEEQNQTEDFTAKEEKSFEYADERGFAFVDEQIDEEPPSEPDEIQSLEANLSENVNDNDFGLQPDDIDHFYREPDYDDEETVEMPEYSAADDQQSSSAAETSFQNETGFEIIDHEPFQSPPNPASGVENIPDVEFETNDQTPAPAELEPESDFAGDDFSAGTESEFVSETSAPETEGGIKPSQILSPVPILDFDELDLLEVSLPENRPVNFADVPAETQPAKVEEISSVEETIEVRDENEDVKSQIADQLSGVNLSAADIDAIADKVVEKLTARLKE